MNNRWRRISDKAFELYQSRGGTDGRHVQDWLEAERLIDEEDDRDGSAARNTPEERAAADGTTPEQRDAASQVPRGSRRRTKSATL
ncbi:MAG TPA: DUF2934 domain-containing protein [Vicinamibacterales bacterium]|nr:DUF2934 domain-containing protein [Vicinamibacterales bacterium]